MPGYEQLRQIRTGHLAKAEVEWRVAAKNLREMAEEARTGMRAKVLAARWHGDAQVSGPFILTTADRFEQAHHQASAIHNVLRHLRENLARHQRDLEALEGEAQEQGLCIQSDGTVVVRLDGRYGADGADGPYSPEFPTERQASGVPSSWRSGTPSGGPNVHPARAQDAITMMAARIARVLTEAANTDADAARALYELTGDDQEYFTGARYASLEAARHEIGAQAAREALALVGSDEHHTDKGLTRLNDHLATHRHNEHFAAVFATALGAEGTLALWAGLLDSHANPEADRSRVETLTHLRDNLGIVLGEATRSDHPDMTGWQKDIITLGFQRVDPTNGSSPYGIQLMSSLMTSGEYETGFLGVYGDALISWEEAMEPPGSGWASHGDGYVPLLGEVFRWDPMTGYMEALSRDPEAATTVFADADRSEYLLKDRPYGNLPVEGGPDGGWTARHAIGEALLAAASGIDPHDPAATFVEHTSEHGEVVGNALQHLSAMGNDFPPEFRQPASQILTNHAAAVMDAINAKRDASAPLDRGALHEVMTQTSRDEVAYGLLNEGMNIEMLRRISEPSDVSINDRSQDGPETSLIHAGKTVGFLEQARCTALSLEMEIDLSGQRMAMYHGLGPALNLVPGIGDVLQRSVDLVTTSWMEDELRRDGEKISTRHTEEFTARENQLTALANEWSKIHLGSSEAPEEWDSRVKLEASIGNKGAGELTFSHDDTQSSAG